MARLSISCAVCVTLLLFVLPLPETAADECVPAFSNGTCPSPDYVFNDTNGGQCCKSQSSVPVAAIVVPIVVGGVLLLVVPIAVYCFVKVRNKRRDEGTYNPNMQEKSSSAAQTGPPGALQRPPEERLI